MGEATDEPALEVGELVLDGRSLERVGDVTVSGYLFRNRPSRWWLFPIERGE